MQPTRPDVDPKIGLLCVTRELDSLVKAYLEFKSIDDAGISAILSGHALSDEHHRNRDDKRTMVMHHVWMITRFLTPDVVKLMEHRAND